MGKQRAGEATLLEESHLSAMNQWGHPVVGWIPNSQGLGGLHNPRGYGLVRIVLNKLTEGILRPLYDQPILVENAGSIVIAQLGDKVGLIQNFRMTGDRILPVAGADYIRELQKQNLWSILISSLGQWQWECPRGLIPPSADNTGNESLEDFALRTAKMEAAEEAGYEITEARVVGEVNTNPTFFAHSASVVHAKIASIGDADHEDLEMIGDSRLFTMGELRDLCNAGEFKDGLTLSALALCGLTLPL